MDSKYYPYTNIFLFISVDKRKSVLYNVVTVVMSSTFQRRVMSCVVVEKHNLQSEWLRSNTQEKTGAGEDVEKDEHSSTTGGVASWYNQSGNQSGCSSENWECYCQRTLLYHSWAYTQKILHHVIRIHAPLCS